MSAVAPRAPVPAKRVSEVDFRSGTRFEQLSAQVQELVQTEQGEFGDQTALEVHTAKDFIFNMLGANTNTVQIHDRVNVYLYTYRSSIIHTRFR